MTNPAGYVRAADASTTSDLLRERHRVALAGGTAAPSGEPLDLQDLGLDDVGTDGERLRIGAMVRLGDLASAAVPALLQELAAAELPSALRNQATVGGTVAAGQSESVLLAGLLVHDCRVESHGGEPQPLSEFLAEGVGDRLITGVTVDPAGAGAWVATGRTPKDVPIVAAVARQVDSGPIVAVTGVAATPVLVDAADPTAGLDPPGDFRGRAEYRLHLTTVLTGRVVGELS